MFDNVEKNKEPITKSANAKDADLLMNKKEIKTNGFINFAERFIKFYRLILGLVILIIIIMTGILLFKMYQININDIKVQKTEKQSILVEKEEDLTMLKSMKIDYENLEISAQKILDALPAEKDLSSVFIQLEKIAQNNNLMIAAINIAEKEDIEEEGEEISDLAKINKMSITVNLSGGDYFSLKSFLADIEKNLRLTDIQSIIYSPEENMYALTLNIYYLLDIDYE